MASQDMKFHFTVTSDIHSGEERDPGMFEEVCQSINNTVGVGAFHVTTGDVNARDGANGVDEIRSIIDTYFGNDTKWLISMGNHDVLNIGETPSDRTLTWLRAEYYSPLNGDNVFDRYSGCYYLDNVAGYTPDSSWAEISYDVTSPPGSDSWATHPSGSYLEFSSVDRDIYYIRKEFNLSAATLNDIQTAWLSIAFDEGAIVYLNGYEVFRYNVNETATEAEEIQHSMERDYWPIDLTQYLNSSQNASFVEGDNVIAVEIFAKQGESSDCGFDAILEYTSKSTPSSRPALKEFVTGGPAGARETQYYWDHDGCRFIVLNPHWDGSDGLFADIGGGLEAQWAARINEQNYNWIKEVIDSTDENMPVFVFCHYPAFPQENHKAFSLVGYGSSNYYPEDRNRFWELLESYSNVTAYFCGHTHDYYRYQVNNNWDNTANVANDIWGDGSGHVWQIESGTAGDDKNDTSRLYTFIDVEVYEGYSIFNTYQKDNSTGVWSKTDSWTVMTTYPISEYGEDSNDAEGGYWFYSQNKIGSEWVNTVDNEKGWTVDFNLKVNEIVNNEFINSELIDTGAGIYINDGKYKENITFLTQEIVFSNINKQVVYDTTQETDYRIIGKKNNLKLYGKSQVEDSYNLLAEVPFNTDTSTGYNSLYPAITEDIDGNLHAVWESDNNSGELYYSYFNNEKWSHPEKIVDSIVGSQSPSVLVDNEGIVYVAYEVQLSGSTSIGFIYKNEYGWSSPFYLGEHSSDSKGPQVAFDSLYNVFVTWSDFRLGRSQIYLQKFDRLLQSFDNEILLTNDNEDLINPAITSYLNNIFVSWTKNSIEGESWIQAIKYSSLSNKYSDIVDISDAEGISDYSSILSNVSGKIFVSWQDKSSGKSKIYTSILSIDLNEIQGKTLISEGNGRALYPQLTEQKETGDIYIVWQDISDGSYSEFTPIEDLNPYNEVIDSNPYLEADKYQDIPLSTTLYMAKYDASTNSFISSYNSANDIKFVFDKNRNAFHHALPISFSSSLPLIYEFSWVVEEDVISNYNLGINVGCAIVVPDMGGDTITVNNYDDTLDEYGQVGDYILSNTEEGKEIRFGDFSNSLNVHYSFKNFKYYTDDAVEPLDINEITASNFSDLIYLNSKDIAINNYGDIWVAGTCGLYYYINSSGKIFNISDDKIDAETSWNKVNSISFSKDNIIYLGTDNGIYYSETHINNYQKVDVSEIGNNNVECITFDRDGKLLAVIENTLYIISMSDNIVIDSIVFNGNVNCITVDDNNIIWIGSNSGLYRYFNNHLVEYTTTNGLPSNVVNDIAIRNSAIRYIATANGIAKMIGSGIDDVINSEHFSLYNNNVKSVLWQDPDILWAGTLSQINQINVDDINQNYTVIYYEPEESNIIKEDDLNLYYVLTEENIDVNKVIDIYINGTLCTHGYDLGYKDGQPIIYFNTPLKNDDTVEVIVHKNLEIKGDLNQTDAEVAALGKKDIRIKDLGVGENEILMVSEGDENEVKIQDSLNNLPYDRVQLDTIPPSGKLNILEQIDKSIIRVSVTDVLDIDEQGNAGSGIDKMVVSNYPNFTTDGETEQTPVDFKSTYEHDLGINLEDNIVLKSFQDGIGTSINLIKETGELFVAESNPAKIYKFDFINKEWETLFALDNDGIVDFIAFYNNQLLISVGFASDFGKLYVYDYIYNNDDIQGYSLNIIETISESRLYCYEKINNLVYMGSGKSNGLGNGGALYKYDGSNLISVVQEIDDDIYNLASTSSTQNILAVTGQSGFVYEIDPENEIAFPIHNDSEPLISIDFIQLSEEGLIFVGGKEKGIIKRSEVESKSFDVSFRTLPSKVSKIKTFNLEDDSSVIYASLGKVLYYLNSNGVWTWKFTHDEDIVDFEISNNKVYVISESKVNQINPLKDDKQIYLKLIDRAGNESVIYNEEGEIKEDFTDSISISNLVDFVNENKIVELDSDGNVIFSLKGDNRFFSADKIEEEKGVYVSEIFDGTNDLVKWDTLSWRATEMNNTKVYVYIRSSSSENDILLENWNGPYTIEQANDLDISRFSGQFIQFKVELLSYQKGISPLFHSATIKSITSESIHFYTTNFVLEDRVTKGILTSKKMVPISADVVFGINTTNSVDWNDYQVVEENRLFNVNQIGENIRVGIKLISPNRNIGEPTIFDEYGPYGSDLFVNTIDFIHINETGNSQNYNYRIKFYEDYDLNNCLYTAYSYEDSEGFTVNQISMDSEGYSLPSGEQAYVLYNVPGYANLKCNTYYFVTIEITNDLENFEIIANSDAFISGCSSTFVDNINFDFSNDSLSVGEYHFKIVFYDDFERTNVYKTIFSGNDKTGWTVGGAEIPDDGVVLSPGEETNIIYRPNLEDFDTGDIYYISIETWEKDSTEFSLVSNSYTYQSNDASSLVYCGGYTDVPIVKNFGIMLELENNNFVTLNV